MPPENDSRSSDGSTVSGRVLVVDDDPDVAESTAMMLEQRNLEAVWETSPRDALERIRTESDEICCVVSDYQMPRVDGLELLASTRDVAPTLPFVLFTGRGSEQIASEAINAGVSAYIQKGGVEQYDRLANRVKQEAEQERTRRELEETKARFDALTRNVSFAIVTVDDDSTIRYANAAVEELFGYAPEELQGESLMALVPDRLAAAHREGIERYLRTGERRLDWDWIELPAVTRDGEEVPVAVSFSERRDESRHLFTGVIRDISERREREAELERMTERFEAVFEAASDPMLVVNYRTGTVTEANSAAGDLFDYPRERLRGFDVGTLCPDDRDELLASGRRARESGRADSFEAAFRTKADVEVPSEVTARSLADADDDRFLAVVRSLSDGR